MNRKAWRAIAVICLIALPASSAASLAQVPVRAIAQERPENQEPEKPAPMKPMPRKPDLEPKIKAPQSPEAFKFVGAEFAFNKLVKGAPYSATALTETSQTLSDGNEITRRMEAKIYRDSDGRTRREQTLDTLSRYTAAGDAPQIVLIDDPVAGLQFTLDPRTHTAHKIKGPPPALARVLGNASEVNEPRAKRIEPFEQSPANGKAPSKLQKAAKGDLEKAKGDLKETKEDLKRHAGNAAQKQPAIPASPAMKSNDVTSESAARRKIESLGKQVVEGVEAEGTRTILTIPAGEIGNRLPIEVTEERWYSPDLQVLVLSNHHDPRSGDRIYRLTNINRSEPDRSLFELPSDYRFVGPGSESERDKPATRPKRAS